MKKIIFMVLLFLSMVSISCSDEALILNLPDKQISLSMQRWEKLKDPNTFARNYEEKNTSEGHEFNRVVTVFLLPMSDDRKEGMRISDNEYLEFMIITPGYVTAQTRIDKGEYWVLCRETFLVKPFLVVDVSKYKPYLTDSENNSLWATYQAEIDETRYLLRQEF